MDKNIPKVEFTIDENSPIAGVKVMSLVDQPAIESDFIFFSKEKPKFVALKGEKFKQVVAGLALIPEKNILRYDEFGEPYYGYFSTETVEKTRTKFHKEQMGSKVNTDHSSDNYIDAFLIESFIIDSEERLSDVKARGIEEATIGSWFVAYKIEDAEAFQRVVDGELRGFSVEIFLSKFFKANNTYQNNFKTEMQNILKKFKDLLAELEESKDTKKFETAKDADGKTISYSVVGEAVEVITSDAEGTEVREVAPDGEYKLDNGKTVIVASGIASEIKDTEAQPEEQKKDEQLSSSVYASYTLADGTMANVNVSSVNEVYIWNGEKSELAATGSYPIKDGGTLHVEDGKFVGVEGVSAGQFDEKKELAKVKANFSKALKEKDSVSKEKESLSKEIESLKAEIEKLKKAPIAKPTTKVDQKDKQLDFSKMSTLEKLAAKNGVQLSESVLKRLNRK